MENKSIEYTTFHFFGCYDADGQMSTVVTDEEINAAAEKANCMEFIKVFLWFSS